MLRALRITGERRVTSYLQRVERETVAAHRRAVRKTTAFAARELVRNVARAHNIPQRVLTRGRVGRSGRLRTALRDAVAGMRGSVWLGVFPVAYSYLGALRQTATGARAGNRSVIPGAFIATMRSGHTGIFTRARKTVRRTEGRPETSPENLPILEEMAVLNKSIGELEQILERVPERYRELARQEMRFGGLRLDRGA